MSKIQAWKRELIFIFLVLLVSSTSFAAGYLLAERQGRAPIIIQQGSSQN